MPNEDGSWPRTFLINLASRTDRLESVTAELTRANVEWERFDGHTAETSATLGIVPADDMRGRELTSGDLGCVGSHLAIFRLIVESGLPGGLILEDDLLIVDDFRERVLSALRRRRPDTMVVQLGWLRYDHNVQIQMKNAAYKLKKKERRDRLIVAPFAFGSHCYWVSSEFAKRSIERMTPPYAPIDLMTEDIRWQENLVFEQCWPPLAVQNTSASDITNRRTHGVEKRPRW